MALSPTFRDCETGQETKTPEWWAYDVWYWVEGNGSCDCNRSLICGKRQEMEERLGSGVCFGCHRFVAIEVEGDLEGWKQEELIAEMNREYVYDRERKKK